MKLRLTKIRARQIKIHLRKIMIFEVIDSHEISHVFLQMILSYANDIQH